MKIFIGGALTNAKQDLFEHYSKLAELFRESGHEVYNPAEKYHEYKSQDVSNQFAFTNCLKHFKTCTHAVMYIGQPSLGVGIELSMLHMLQMPTIVYWFEGDTVSDYALGFAMGSENFYVGFPCGKHNPLMNTIELNLNKWTKWGNTDNA